MIDLGAWATEAYRVPVEDENDGLEDESFRLIEEVERFLRDHPE